MKRTHFKYTGLGAAIAGLIVLAPMAAQAEADGMVPSLTGFDVNETEFMKDLGLTVGGWGAFGFTFNAHGPDDKQNDPVLFNDRHAELQGNQINLFIERAVNTEGDSWDLGFRADILYGTDARFTQATGLDDELIGDDFRFYKLAFPQFYLEAFAPIFNGVTAKVGHFYTIIGNEVVTAPDNFFYSHAYTMLFAEPFTHTGALLETPITDNFTVTAGAVMGWDNFSENANIWNFLGGVNWTSDDQATSITATAVQGEVSRDRPGDDRWMYSVVLSHDITEDLHYLIQHDYGREEFRRGEVFDDRVTRDTRWYGINQYLSYDINEEFAAGIRAEWFRDHNGARVIEGARGNYFAITTGVNWTPLSWLKVRPELRYDWFDGEGKPFDGGTRSSQFTVGTDFILTF